MCGGWDPEGGCCNCPVDGGPAQAGGRDQETLDDAGPSALMTQQIAQGAEVPGERPFPKWGGGGEEPFVPLSSYTILPVLLFVSYEETETPKVNDQMPHNFPEQGPKLLGKGF